MLSPSKRALVAASIVGLCALGLAACDPIASQGELAATIRSDEVVVVMCDTLEVSSLLIEQRGPNTGNRWVELLFASGRAEMVGEVDPENLPVGLVIEQTNELLEDPDSDISIQVVGRTEKGSVVTWRVKTDMEELHGEHGRWIRADDGSSSEPCE